MKKPIAKPCRLRPSAVGAPPSIQNENIARGLKSIGNDIERTRQENLRIYTRYTLK